MRQVNAGIVALTLLGFAYSARGENLSSGAVAEVDMEPWEREFKKATVNLFEEDEEGNLNFVCTATAFARTGKKYYFVSAAHCVGDDDTDHEKVVTRPSNWYITFRDPGAKHFFPAKILVHGYQHRLNDFVVLEVELEHLVPTMSLAANDPHNGEIVSNLASPHNLGKLLFRGLVSMESVDRTILVGEDEVNWKGTAVLQINVGGGSSGSAIVSQRQKGIVAILIGMNSGSMAYAIPVSKFKQFWAEFQAKKYKWYRPEENQGKPGKKKKHKKSQINGQVDTADYRGD